MIEFLRLSAAYRDAVTSASWIAELPDTVRDDLLAGSRRRSVPSGSHVFRRGDPTDGIFCVLEGVVRTSGNSRDGHETIMDLYGAGAWFGEVAALAGTPRIHDVVAVANAELIHLPQAPFERLLEAHPDLTRALLRLEANRLRLLLLALEGYSAQSMEQRLANRLLMLAQVHGDPTNSRVELRLKLTQETMAKLVGTSRQRVSQILKHWQQNNIVSYHTGELIIERIGDLEQLGQL